MKEIGLKEELSVLGGAVEDLIARKRRERGEGDLFPAPPPAPAPLGELDRAVADLAQAASSPRESGDVAEAAELIRRAIARLRELA